MFLLSSNKYKAALFLAFLFLSVIFFGGISQKVSATTSTSLAMAETSSTYRGTITYTATLTETSGGAPISGKTVEFMYALTLIGTSTTDGSGVATLVASTTEDGTPGGTLLTSNTSYDSGTIYAHFTGDTDSAESYVPYSSDTLVTINSNAILAVDDVSTVYGGTVTYTATLTETSGGAPISGKDLDFQLTDSNFDTFDLGTSTTDGSGVATLVASTTVDGTPGGDSLISGLNNYYLDVYLTDSDLGDTYSEANNFQIDAPPAPTFISATTTEDGTSITVAFSKTMVTPPDGNPIGLTLSVNGGPSTSTFSGANINGDPGLGYLLGLDLITPVSFGDTLVLSYDSSTGFVTSEDGGTLGDFTEAVTNAVPGAETYTVTFDKNGGDVDADPLSIADIASGATVVLPTPPTWPGHTFAGWNTETDGSGTAFYGDTPVSADVTVYAQWTASAPATLYFNNAVDGDWNNLGNWWTNEDFAPGHEAASLPVAGDDVVIYQDITVNNGSPVSVNTLTATSSAQISIPVTVTNGAFFFGTSTNRSNITGDATFYDSSYGIDLTTVSGVAKYAYATGGVITVPDGAQWSGTAGSVVGIDDAPISIWIFNGSSVDTNDIVGTTTFNNSSDHYDGIITGNVTFNDSSLNEAAIVGDVILNGDLSENDAADGGTIDGTKTRYYTTSTTNGSRDFVADGPWTVVADGAGVVVNLAGSNYDETTTFEVKNGGSFLPESIVPEVLSGAAPTFVSATTTEDGNNVYVAFSKTMNNPAGNAADAEAFTLSVNGGASTSTFSATNLNGGDANIINLALATSVSAGDVLLLSYNAATGTVTSADTGVLATFADQSVANAMPVVDNTAPTVTELGDGSTDVVIGDGGADGLVFSEPLSAASQTTVETAISNGSDRTLTYTWSDSTLTIHNDSGDAATFDYDVYADISDLVGNTTAHALLINSAYDEGETESSSTDPFEMDGTHKNLVITDSSLVPSLVRVPESVTDATLDINNLINGNATGTLPDISIDATTSLGLVDVVIFSGTVVSGGNGWNGVLNVPTIKLNSSVTPTADSGYTANVTNVIEVGYGDVAVNFDQGVRIGIAGQAGKLAGYSRGGVFTAINTTCAADSANGGGTLTGDVVDCKTTQGSDLVIWTKHFTSFVTYTQTAIVSVNANTGGGGGGGGGYFFNPYTALINSGVTSTVSANVTLSLTSGAGVNQMWISNDYSLATSTGTGWIPFQSTYSWILTPGLGNKTVYVRFRATDSVVVSGTAQAAIALTAVGPAETSGQTNTQLQNLLNQLLIQLQALTAKAKAAGISVPAGTTASDFVHDLKLGTTHDDVKLIQGYLNNHGFPVSLKGSSGSKGHETKYFGLATKKALAAFQASVGISPASGYFGPLTRGYINSHP